MAAGHICSAELVRVRVLDTSLLGNILQHVVEALVRRVVLGAEYETLTLACDQLSPQGVRHGDVPFLASLGDEPVLVVLLDRDHPLRNQGTFTTFT